MKRLITDKSDIFTMSNLSPKRTGLKCYIWIDDTGSSRNTKHNTPRVKISKDDYEISVSIDENPKILAKNKDIPHSVMKYMKESMEYVSKVHDILLKYFKDGGINYDTQDMFYELRDRGYFK